MLGDRQELVDLHRSTLCSLFQPEQRVIGPFISKWYILILDEKTERIINHLFDANTLRSNGISIVLKIGDQRQAVADAECIYLITATEKNVNRIVDDMNKRLYAATNVIFTSIDTSEPNQSVGSPNKTAASQYGLNNSLVRYFANKVRSLPDKSTIGPVKSIKTYPIDAWDIIPGVFIANSSSTHDNANTDAIYSYISSVTDSNIPILAGTPEDLLNDKPIAMTLKKRFKKQFGHFKSGFNVSDISATADSIMLIFTRADDLAAPFMPSNSYIGNIIHLGAKEEQGSIKKSLDDSILSKLWDTPFLETPDLLREFINEHKKAQESVREGSAGELEAAVDSIKDISARKAQMDHHFQMASQCMRNFIRLNEMRVKCALDSFLKSSEEACASKPVNNAAININSTANISASASGKELGNAFPYDVTELLKLFEDPSQSDDESKRAACPWSMVSIRANAGPSPVSSSMPVPVNGQISIFDNNNSNQTTIAKSDKKAELSVEQKKFLGLLVTNILSTLAVCILSSYPAMNAIDLMSLNNSKESFYTDKYMPEWWGMLGKVAFKRIQEVVDEYANGVYEAAFDEQFVTKEAVDRVRVDPSCAEQDISTSADRFRIYFLLQMRPFIYNSLRDVDKYNIKDPTKQNKYTVKTGIMSTLKKGIKNLAVRDEESNTAYSKFLAIPKMASAIYEAIIKYRLSIAETADYAVASTQSATAEQRKAELEKLINEGTKKATKYTWPLIKRVDLSEMMEEKTKIVSQSVLSAAPIKRICLYIIGGITWDEIAAFKSDIQDIASKYGLSAPICTIGGSEIINRREFFNQIMGGNISN